MKLEAAQIVDRRVRDVFRWYADDHVRNHPRWDPDIELESTSDERMRVGTVIRRRNARSGTPVEGTMEVVEYERDRSFGVIIRDGPMEIRGRATFEELSDGRTRLTIVADMPIDESMGDHITGLMQRSLENLEGLVEAER